MLSSILRQQRVAAAASASSSSSRVLASSPLLRGLFEASHTHARDPYNYQLIYVPVRGLSSWWGKGNKEGGGGAAAAAGKGKGGGAGNGGGAADKDNGGSGTGGGEGGGSSSSSGNGSSKEGERVVVVENRGSKGSSNSSSNGGSDGHPSDAVAKVGAGENAPRHPHVLALPILRRPFFPGLVQAVNITSPKVFEAISSIKNDYGHYYVGTFMRKEEPLEGSPPEVITDMSQIHAVGTLAQVQNTIPLGMGGQVVLVSHRRIKIDGPFAVGPPLRVKVSHLEGKSYDSESNLIKAYSNEVVSTVRELVKVNPLFKEHFNFYTQKIDIVDPFKLADFAATLSTAEGPELQGVLEELDAERRLNKALILIKKELELGKIQQEIQQQVEAKISQKQREYFLMEQLKYIKKELGMEKDDKEALLAKFRDRMKDVKAPELAKTAIDEELEKLEALEKNSSEFNVTRNYLEWLTSLPWGLTSVENFDLKRAKTILDEDHYGLQEIKNRILEFMAVSKLKGSTQGKILCFVGPPGVGKTSIGKSIARALGREFHRFSVGGLYDVAEIKGHRRTYVGAMPGKIIQCLKTVQTSNPLVLIDEIDKLGRDRGDPASALLELLDPNQNESFIDHYLDVPVDMSKVLFICTANLIDTIPGPLLDRMEVIRLSGYDLPEKVAIAQQYLVPKARTEAGIPLPSKAETAEATAGAGAGAEAEAGATATAAGGGGEVVEEEGGEGGERKEDGVVEKKVGVPESLAITEGAIDALIRWYCREAGVRNLEKHIEKICRKLAHEVVQKEEGVESKGPEEGEGEEGRKEGEDDVATRKDWAVTEKNLEKYVGKRVFTSDRLYEGGAPPGVVMGLSWTAMGGASLYIEVQSVRHKSSGGGTLTTTGQMGSVMEESTRISHTFARRKLEDFQADNAFFDMHDLHMHVPEGAIPKEGPSAGVTMTTALLSLALNRPVRADVAMTGEISLTGKVLPVGGIKEKTIAARRSGVTCLVFPAGNKKDFEDLPGYLKEGLEVHFASKYDEVFDCAFAEESGGAGEGGFF